MGTSPLEMTAELAILAENPPRGSCAEVRIVNGALATGKEWVSCRRWDLASTLTLTVRCAEPTAESNAPAVPLRNASWVPFHPLAVDVPGRVDDLFRGMRDTYVSNWLYDVELGAQQLAVFGLMDPKDARIDDMLNEMEDSQFPRDGAGAYPATMNRGDWFNMGGFAKAQPYYAQIPELYALRDDVKPFLRSYFNSAAALINGRSCRSTKGLRPFASTRPTRRAASSARLATCSWPSATKN